MLHSGKKGMLKKLLSFCLSVCLVIGAVATDGRFISYGDDLNRGDSVSVDMNQIMKTLKETNGEGKNCNLSNLPEEMQAELEDAVVVQKGTVNGLKYYMTAEYMGDADPESYSDGFQGISVFFVNQSSKKTVEMPAVLLEGNDTCTLTMADEPEQVWEQLEEDEPEDNDSMSQPGLDETEAGTAQQQIQAGGAQDMNGSGKEDSTAKAMEEDKAERETKGVPYSEGKAVELKGTLPSEGQASEPERTQPSEEKPQEPERTQPSEEKPQEPESTQPSEEKPQEPESTQPSEEKPQESQDVSDSVNQSSASGDISSETEYPTVPKTTDAEAGTAAPSEAEKATPSEAEKATPSEAEKATPSEAVPGNAEDGSTWEVNPLSAKRIFIQAQFREAEAQCTFLTDVQVTVDGGNVEDTPIDIDKKVLISWEYTIPAEGGITKDTKYTFDIPKVFDFTNLTFPIKYGDDEIAKVTLNEYKGTLTFNDKAESMGLLNPGTKGQFSAYGGIAKDQIGNGGLLEVPFSMGKAIKIYFPLIPILVGVKLEKTAELDSVNNKIRWTITVTPQMEHVQDVDKKLHSLIISDTLSDQAGFLMAGTNVTDTKFEVVGPDTSALSGGTLTVASDKKGFTYTFPEDITAQGTYTVSYDTVFGLNSWNGAATDTVFFANTANRDFSYYDYKIDNATKKPVLSADVTEVTGTDESKATGTKDVEGGFIKKSGEKSTDGKTIEWILTINKNKYSMGKIRVTDTITAKTHEKKAPGMPIDITGIQIKNGDGDYKDVTASSTINKDKYKSSFILNVDSVSDIVEIKYTTSIDDNFRLSNETTEFSNAVLLTIAPDTADAIGIEGKGEPISTGFNLLEKKGEYSPAAHSILWTIQVNDGHLPLTNACVEDVIPEGLTLVGGKGGISSSGGTVEFSESDKKIKVSYGASYNGTDTITFSTTVDNPDLWAVNTTAETTFRNTATIAAGGMAQASYSKTAECTVTSTVFEKSGVIYDPVSKQVKWNLSINENKMTMTNAVIIDTIPEGQKFVDGKTIESSFLGWKDVIESYDYNEDMNQLTINLSSPLNDHKDIQYNTELTDLSILENNDKKEVGNTAQLQCSEMSGTKKFSESTASQEVSKSIITKTGVCNYANGVEGIIAWTVNLNQNRVAVVNPVLTDNLNENLSLVTDSVKLTRINADTSETQETIDASSISYVGNQFVFSFNKTIKDAYRLEFNTYFKVDGDYTNSIDLAGNSGTLHLIGNSASVEAKYQGGEGGTRPMNSGQIRVIKKDETTGAAIQGVTFSLSKGSVSQTAVTDGSGIAEFTQLWAGTYILKEIDAPDEYYFDPANQQVITLANGDAVWKEYNITNKCKYGALRVIKVSMGTDTPLAGARIALYGQGGVKIESKVTGEDGLAEFGPIKYGDYLLVEEEAPAGYVLDTSGHPVAFHITSDGQMMEQRFENQETPANSGHGGGGGGSSTKPGSSAAQGNGPGVEPEASPSKNLELPSEERMTQLQTRLPQGNYTMYKLDERGAILDEQHFVILDSTVPLTTVGGYGLPKVGDRRWSAQVWAALAGLSFAAILWLRKKYRGTAGRF